MNKNKVLIVSLLAAMVYFVIAITTWIALFNNRAQGWSALFALLYDDTLIPSLLLVIFGISIGIKAYTKNKRWLTLCSVTLYLIAALIVYQLGIYLIPAIGFGVIAFIQLGNQAKKAKAATEDLLP